MDTLVAWRLKPRWAWTLLVGVLAGCASGPPAGPSPAQAVTEPSAVTGVVARGERLLVYLPAPGDSLRSIAGRLLGDEGRDWQIAEANGGSPRV